MTERWKKQSEVWTYFTQLFIYFITVNKYQFCISVIGNINMQIIGFGNKKKIYIGRSLVLCTQQNGRTASALPDKQGFFQTLLLCVSLKPGWMTPYQTKRYICWTFSWSDPTAWCTVELQWHGSEFSNLSHPTPTKMYLFPTQSHEKIGGKSHRVHSPEEWLPFPPTPVLLFFFAPKSVSYSKNIVQITACPPY